MLAATFVLLLTSQGIQWRIEPSSRDPTLREIYYLRDVASLRLCVYFSQTAGSLREIY
jgi:hypothetical protein